MTLAVIINGETFTGFTKAQVKIQFLNATGKASFRATFRNAGAAYPIRVGDVCQITADGTPIITGFVETLTASISSDSHMLVFGMRDAIADLIDSTIDSSITNEINAPATLEQVCTKVLAKLNINIPVVNRGGDTPFKSGDIITPKLKETAFKFLERYAQKQQVILRASGRGELLLDRGSNSSYRTSLNLDPDAPAINNIKSRELNIDFTGRFNTYIYEGQGSAAVSDLSGYDDSNANTIVGDLVDVRGTAVDSAIRSGRRYAFTPEATYEKESAAQRAVWESNIRRAKSLKYTCKVQGFTAALDDRIWEVNNLVLVNDPLADIKQVMLLDEVTYEFSMDQGSVSTLCLVSKDAYTLQAQRDLRTSAGERDGGNLAAYDEV